MTVRLPTRPTSPSRAPMKRSPNQDFVTVTLLLSGDAESQPGSRALPIPTVAPAGHVLPDPASSPAVQGHDPAGTGRIIPNSQKATWFRMCSALSLVCA